AEAPGRRNPQPRRPGAVHRNVVAAALRADAELLPQEWLRPGRHAARLLRRRRQHGGVSEEVELEGGKRGEKKVPPSSQSASPITDYPDRRDSGSITPL